MPVGSGGHDEPGSEAMTQPSSQRRLAARCFNETWKLLEKMRRTPAEERRMLLLAHASRLLWEEVGGPRNLAIGDWMVSRVYAALKEPRLSLLFAQSSLVTVRKHRLRDLLPSALEGVARAYAVARNRGKAAEHLEMAEKELDDNKEIEAEDRKVYRAQISETKKLIR